MNMAVVSTCDRLSQCEFNSLNNRHFRCRAFFSSACRVIVKLTSAFVCVYVARLFKFYCLMDLDLMMLSVGDGLRWTVICRIFVTIFIFILFREDTIGDY